MGPRRVPAAGCGEQGTASRGSDGCTWATQASWHALRGRGHGGRLVSPGFLAEMGLAPCCGQPAAQHGAPTLPSGSAQPGLTGQDVTKGKSPCSRRAFPSGVRRQEDAEAGGAMLWLPTARSCHPHPEGVSVPSPSQLCCLWALDEENPRLEARHFPGTPDLSNWLKKAQHPGLVPAAATGA